MQVMLYTCSLCGYFQSGKLCKLLTHISQNHSLDYRFFITCGLENCPQTFRNFASYKSHLYRKHREHFVNNIVDDESNFHCPVCHYRVNSPKQAIQHLKVHITVDNGIECPYEGCNSVQNLHSSLRTHVSRYHKNDNELKGTWFAANDEELEQDIADDQQQNDIVHIANHKEKYTETLALLLLKLEVVDLIPATTIQKILDALSELLQLSNNLTSDLVKCIFRETDNLDIEIVENVCRSVGEQCVFLEAYEQLKTDYKRKLFYKDKFQFVEPVSLNLGRNANNDLCSFFYIPLLKTIENLVSVDDNLAKVLNPEPIFDQPQLLKGYTESRHYRNSQIVEPWIRIILYFDEFEVVNPIGAHRGKYKVAAIYFSIDNFGLQENSGCDSIYLLLLCPSKDFTHENLPNLIGPLCEDLHTLQDHGINVGNHNLKGSVIFVAGDNLGSHFLGGFYESFGPLVKRPCRFCLCRNENMQTEFDASKFVSRTKENYKRQVELVQADPSLCNQYGLKADSPLNKLPLFHVTSGLPADCMHDMLEGVVPYEMGLCLTELCQAGYFTTEYLNRRIMSFPYGSLDGRNKPVECRVSGRVINVKQNASRNWCLLRLLPLLIGHLIPVGNCFWELLLNLKQCLDIILAPVITCNVAVGLGHLVQENLQLFRHLFPDSRIKPKQHFMLHYPEQILNFGPLRSTWTMRFEAKHLYMKRILQSAKNFKNPCKTLAIKHELRMACLSIGVSLSNFEYVVPECLPVEILSFPEDIGDQLRTLKITSQVLQTCQHISIRNITYKIGMFVMLEFQNEEPVFGCISEIIVHNNSAVFVSVVNKSEFCEHLSAYEVTATPTRSVKLQTELASFYPLTCYKVSERSYVVLKYFVPDTIEQ